MDSSTTIIFIILAFSLGAILIMKKDSIPSNLRRPMAIVSLLLVAFAFFLIIYSAFRLGAS